MFGCIMCMKIKKQIDNRCTSFSLDCLEIVWKESQKSRAEPWTGCIKHLKATSWNCNPSIFNTYSAQMGRAPGGTTSAAASATDDWIFMPGSFIRSAKGVSHWGAFSPHLTWLKSTVLPANAHSLRLFLFRIWHFFNQAFLLTPNVIDLHNKKFNQNQKCAVAFCLKRSTILSDSPHNSPAE